ncbi:MAG: prolyl oligopeptidase family serine peptidase [Candidatus Sumerlaeales bacterium]|nr:prolyl oligopeptidase family serine peptidase [Candidatus Sumerlaeales bacterium]
MRYFEKVVLFIMLMLTSLTGGAAIAPEERFITSSYDGSQQPYMILTPEKNDKGETDGVFPLLVALHGYGPDHKAWMGLDTVVEACKRNGIILVTPYGRGNWFYRQSAEQDVLDIIEQVKKDYSIDVNRIALIGHSMGGWGTSWIGLRHPELFSTILPFSGWTSEELLPNAMNLDPFIMHDCNDKVVDPNLSRREAAALTKLGISLRYLETAGYGHSTAMLCDNIDEICQWILNHRHVQFPKRISLATRTPWERKAYSWLKLLSLETFPDIAVVKAELTSGSEVLTISTKNVKSFAIDIDGLTTAGASADLRIQCDMQTVPFSKKNKWLVFEKTNGILWEEMTTSDVEPDAIRPDIFKLNSTLNAITTVGKSKEAADAIGAALLERFANQVDIIVLYEPQFMVPPGGLNTPERALDVAVGRRNKLEKFTVTGKDLKAVIVKIEAAGDKNDNRIYPSKIDIVDNQEYRVIASEGTYKDVFERYGKCEYMPKEIGIYLAELFLEK